MRMISKNFEFVSNRLEPNKRRAVFNYKIEFENMEPLVFKETLVFPRSFSTKGISPKLLDNILSSVQIILGISYYKLYCPRKIKMAYVLSKEQAEFWNTVYRKGLGEFFYQNKIDPKNLIKFPFSAKAGEASFIFPRKDRVLLGIGGGKESVVAAELLKKHKIEFDSFVVETQKESPIISKILGKIESKSLIIKRKLDEKIFKSLPGAYNGHIPISAVFAFLGQLCAVLYDYSYVIVGNEFSSNFGNLRYKDDLINHQWSKSQEFETLFGDYARKYICPDIIYFSLLRPFQEIHIAEMFSKHKKYFSYFTSCNRSFRIQKEKPEFRWCGECPKCVFSFLLLSAFLSKKELAGIFKKNIYESRELLPLMGDILGFGKMKPFDCVGTFEEARAALYLSRNKFRGSLAVKTFIPRIKNFEKIVREVFKTNNAPSMPAMFKLIGIKNALILGYGKEGKVTKRYLEKYFPKLKIKIADKKTDPHYLKKQEGFDLAIKTPGISKNFVTIPYTTATNLFFSKIKNITIGVTGSKGKSTTASLIYSILKKSGKKATLLGNIGNPMLETLMRPIDPREIFIIELSSYQLDDIEYSPNIAVILNFFPEHMNYHGDVEKYYVAKKNIIKFQNYGDCFVYNEKNVTLKKCAKQTRAKGVSFNGNIDLKNIKIPLRGRHNEENIKAAIAVANIFHIPNKIIKKSIEEFQPLPHRLEYIGEFDGIKFYDDAISTTPESTMMALEALPKVKTIFLGGEDRGYDFSELEKYLKKYKIKNIVLFPDSGKRMLKSRRKLNILKTSSMKEAVMFAYKYTPKGTKCLLSTASPSYSLWENFEEKGDQYQYFIKKLSHKASGNRKKIIQKWPT